MKTKIKDCRQFKEALALSAAISSGNVAAARYEHTEKGYWEYGDGARETDEPSAETVALLKVGHTGRERVNFFRKFLSLTAEGKDPDECKGYRALWPLFEITVWTKDGDMIKFGTLERDLWSDSTHVYICEKVVSVRIPDELK